MVQDEDRSLIEVKTCKTPVELVALGDRELVTPEARFDLGHHAHLDDGSPLISLRLPMAGPDEQAVEPWIDRRRIAEPADVAPSVDERILGRVLGTIPITEDQAGDRIQSADRRRGERIEGVMIALPRAIREVSLHPIHLGTVRRGRRAALTI